MTDDEKSVLLDMYHMGASPEMCLWFCNLTHATRDRKAVRRTVRSLAAKGLTFYQSGLINEDTGEVAGSGYGLTEEGLRQARKYAEEMDREERS